MSGKSIEFARVGAHSQYLDIANDHFRSFREKETHVTSYVKNFRDGARSCESCERFERYNEKDERILYSWKNDGVISIVFYSMFLESFIYDYACIFLEDSYVSDYLDKLDFISKWIVVPKIAHGYDIDRSAEFFSRLRRINKDRNSLVHSKSKPINYEFSSSAIDDHKEFKSSVLNSNRAVKLALLELNDMSGNYPVAAIFKVV